MAISDVQNRGGWYHIINSSGNSNPLPHSVGNLIGVGMDFVIAEKGGWYFTYDEYGNSIASLPCSAGQFRNAMGGSFNLMKGSWVYSYNKNCQQTGTRPV